ncbi:hypothetical protein F5Y13DRAFT_31052 [Hypoxylon sp. FL1857]|nr:hypothetical protein F5Y13DRAFT_31052 [Hypoxylon sp. FL1857]
MGLRRIIHFSFHDTRCLMTLEPFANKDEGVFVNPVTVESHRCQVQLPIDGLRYVSERSANGHALGRCVAHTCCVVWIIDQVCSECSKDASIADCPLFMECNEYVPYESVMNGLIAGQPRWVADLPLYPELFYSGRRFDERSYINEIDVAASRKTLFSAARDILVARRDLKRRVQYRQQCFDRISIAKEDLCQVLGPHLHYQVSNLRSDIKAAKKLASVTAEAFVHARRLLEVSGQPPSILAPWVANWEGPLIKDLVRLTIDWTQLVETWQGLR